MELRDETPIQTSQRPASTGFISQSNKVNGSADEHYPTYISFLSGSFFGYGGTLGLKNWSVPPLPPHDENSGSMGAD